MAKGNLVTMALIAAAVVLVASGNWAVVIFGAIFVQIDRVAARLIERRSTRQPPSRSHRFRRQRPSANCTRRLS